MLGHDSGRFGCCASPDIARWYLAAWTSLRGPWDGTERRSRPVQGSSPAKTTTSHMGKGVQTGLPLARGPEEPQGLLCYDAVHRRREGRAA